MTITTLEQHLAQDELYQEIERFANSKDTGALATDGPAGLRVSPVKYFMGDDLNIYIYSQGGSKFANLRENQAACLLTATDFGPDGHAIKGVQFFGQTEILEPPCARYAEAIKRCPWPSNGDAKLIHLVCEHAVFVDRLERSDLKQEWSRTKGN